IAPDSSRMAQYLSQSRIEGPIWLEPDDISLLQTRLSEAGTHVEALEKQISELTRQKDAKLVEVASFRNLLSPIRRIPVEILSEILELSCLPNDGNLTADYDIIRYASMVSRGPPAPVLKVVSIQDLLGHSRGIETFLDAPRLQHVSIDDAKILTWLSIRTRYADAMLLHKVNLLHGLTAPLLEDLTLRRIDQDIDGLASDVIGLQDRSVISLSAMTLTLHCRMGYDEEYITQNLLLILATFPAVKSLRIDQDWSHDDDETDDPVYDVDALVKAMIYTKGHPVLLPKLTNFELSIGELPLDMSMELTSIKPMIHSRWWPDRLESEFDNDICRLQKVVLRGPSTRMKISREDFELLGLIVDFEANSN
ncbi:hypothetical protein BT96DRAFT_918561, partial [Gymnopus androsaceus JB14]